MILASLIAPHQHLLILALLLALTALGLIGEERGWYRKFSGVMVTLIAAVILALTGVLPSSKSEVPLYSLIGGTLMPLAVPLLLLNASLRRMLRECGRLLGAFLLAGASVILGVVLSAFFLDLGAIEPETGGLFVATWIGGFVNFVATAEILGVTGRPVFLSAIATDGILNTLQLAIIFALPAWTWFARKFRASPEGESIDGTTPAAAAPAPAPWRLEDATLALMVSAAIVGLAALISPWLQATLGLRFRVNLIVVTLLILALANLFPHWCGRLHASAFPLGVLFLYLFIAYIGLGIDVQELMAAGPGVFIFGCITIAVHLIVHFTAGRLFGFTLQELCLASNAAIGGPTTAAPMAVSFKMPYAVTPAILIGLFGYSTGTFLGLTMTSLLR